MSGLTEWCRRIWARFVRWWHCLKGTFGPHRMEDITIRKGWYNRPVWIGCECGETFWWDKKYWPSL
jgi:hypothetical protein